MGGAPNPDALTSQELDLRKKELDLREREIEQKAKARPTAAWTNPTVVGIFVAAIGLAGNAVVALLNGASTRDLEQQRGEYARVLEMIKVGDPDQAAANLRMLLESGLYTDHSGKLASYLEQRAPGQGAFLPTPAGERASIDPESQKILAAAAARDAPWLKIALGEVGVAETPGPENNPRIVEYIKSTNWPSDASDDVSWNSAYLNWVFEQSGQRGTDSMMGKSWESWGKPLDEPRPGAIVIFQRGDPGTWTRHAGFYVGPGKAPNTIVVLGGNTADGVRTTEVPADRAVAFRWPDVANQ